jgi:hypothetical protein
VGKEVAEGKISPTKPVKAKFFFPALGERSRELGRSHACFGLKKEEESKA